MTPTPSQLRALEVFGIIQELPEDKVLVRAAAVAKCLGEEGVKVEFLWMWRLDVTGYPQVDVEVVEVDGAFVDANGIHPDWEQVISCHGLTLSMYKKGSFPLKSDPRNPGWLGKKGLLWVDEAVDALRSRLQQQSLNDAAPQSSPYCSIRRF